MLRECSLYVIFHGWILTHDSYAISHYQQNYDTHFLIDCPGSKLEWVHWPGDGKQRAWWIVFPWVGGRTLRGNTIILNILPMRQSTVVPLRNWDWIWHVGIFRNGWKNICYSWKRKRKMVYDPGLISAEVWECASCIYSVDFSIL